MRTNISESFNDKYIDFLAFDDEEKIGISLGVVVNETRAFQLWATVAGPIKPSWFNRREIVMAEFYNDVVPVIKNSYRNNSEINEQSLLEGIIESIVPLGISELMIDIDDDRLFTMRADRKKAYFPTDLF